MKHRALVRVAVAALAVTVAGLVAGSPAAAEEQPPTPKVSTATLDLKGTVTAGQFGTKSCEGVPGGAKAGSDGRTGFHRRCALAVGSLVSCSSDRRGRTASVRALGGLRSPARNCGTHATPSPR